nr:SCO family protein [Nocardioides perillae]
MTTVAGETVDFGEEQDNRLSLLFFGYTSCPDVCSAVMATVASALTRLEPEVREEVEVYFVTTDPETDTAPVLTDYLARFDPDFTGVRADLAQTASLGRSVGIFVDEGSEGVAADPDLHGTYVVGVDQAGDAPIVWRSDTSASELATDITTLVDG